MQLSGEVHSLVA